MFKIRVRGPRACFTRPELKAERVSYDVITPSATIGILEAILWKPAIRWHVKWIDVLAPVRWASSRTNEVANKASARNEHIVADSSTERQQRNMVYLRDVDYVIGVDFSMTEHAGERDSVQKFNDMFARRLSLGQHFRPPVLGVREFPAIVEEAPAEYTPQDLTRPYGRMFYGYDHPGEGKRPMFFDAKIVKGRLEVPDRRSVLLAHGHRSVQC